MIRGRIIGIATAGFYRLDALAVVQPTSLNHCRKQCGWGFVVLFCQAFGGSMIWQTVHKTSLCRIDETPIQLSWWKTT